MGKKQARARSCGGARKVKIDKFQSTTEPWNIKKAVWEAIGKDQKASAPTVPAQFGRAPRDFSKHCHHFSGEEWKMQSSMFLPIYLKDKLPEEDYKAFCHLTKTIELATAISLTDRVIDTVEKGFAEFNKYYEDRFYGQKWERLPACLPVIHQLLHVHHGLRWVGPMHVYAQWAMERVCGSMTRTAKSRVCANRNMELTLLATEQKLSLSYVLALEDWKDAEKNAARRELERSREYADDNAQEIDEDDQLEFDALGLERVLPVIDLAEVFMQGGDVLAERVTGARPPESRTPAQPIQGMTLKYESRGMQCRPQMGYRVYGLVGQPESITATEKTVFARCLRAFITSLQGFAVNLHTSQQPPQVDHFRWCHFVDVAGHKKFDFKVTSRAYKLANNTRNASLVEWVKPGIDSEADGGSGGDAGLPIYYGEVQYFFTAQLPEELSLPSDMRLDGEGPDDADVILQALALVRQFHTAGTPAVKLRNGGLVVIHVKWIRGLVGMIRNGGQEFMIRSI